MMKRLISAVTVAAACLWVFGPVPGAAQAPSLFWVTQGISAAGEPPVRSVISATRPASAQADMTNAKTVVIGNVGGGLTVVATFDSSITSDPNAAAIENAINTAIADYASNFSNALSIPITFKEMASGLGQSVSLVGTYAYSSFLPALKGTATTADDATAYALLPNSSTNPVDGGSDMTLTAANFNAIGVTVGTNGQPYGTISVNTSQTSPGSAGTTGSYDIISVVQHEIDEVLGMGSLLPNSGSPFPTDLFRYNGSGARSFALSPSALAYLSIDGTTRIVQFNNVNNLADAGDWATNSPAQVQDAFGTPGSHPRVANSELTNLDVIGWRRVPQNTFTDNTLTAGVTTIKAVHITELRTRIQAQRNRFGLGVFSYSTPTITASTTTIKASVIAELRQALAEAYVAGGFAVPSYTDPALTVGTTTIKAVHITELRAAVVSLEAR